MGTDKRFSITMSDELYEQVDEFRHENKYATQTKAIAYLVRQGLRTLNGQLDGMADGATEALQVSSFKSLEKILDLPDGYFLDGHTPIISERAAKVLVAYGQLSPAKQEELLNYADYLLQKEKPSEEG